MPHSEQENKTCLCVCIFFQSYKAGVKNLFSVEGQIDFSKSFGRPHINNPPDIHHLQTNKQTKQMLKQFPLIPPEKSCHSKMQSKEDIRSKLLYLKTQKSCTKKEN